MPASADFTPAFPYQPAGDQPQAIADLTTWLQNNQQDNVLLGVTGSGKTFTMANVIANCQRPALVLAHNKTLAAQLYDEFKAFFPENAVEYFVSYYDYYQPEAYVARSDTYIEKTAQVNEQIDRLRHAATRSLLERRDVIVIASVSCIYGIGDPQDYAQMTIPLVVGDTVERDALTRQLINLQYTRNDLGFERGCFRVKGDVLDIFPSHFEDAAWRIAFFDDEIERITQFDPLTGATQQDEEQVTVYPNSHYVIPKPALTTAIEQIKIELKDRLAELDAAGKLLESQRLNERVTFDLEMMVTMGYCNGIENYSRHLTGRQPGEAPPTLFDYLPQDALIFVDESHVTVPQIGGMYKGDRARKETLVQYGFRLPSAMDNRPLKFEEWDARRGQSIFVSATPAAWERQRAEAHITEQIVRPTGLVDPPIIMKPVTGQVDDLLHEIKQTTQDGFRTLVTTLTKKMAEQLTEYLHENKIKVRYLHSDIDTLERAEIIRELRLGTFDVLVGINLLREGLDIPEVALVAILDADKEGFLRSATSLIQTAGRAARNTAGRVILYADTVTGAIRQMQDECDRRRTKQLAHNEAHNITPQTTTRSIKEKLGGETPENSGNQAGRRGKKGEKRGTDQTKPMAVDASRLPQEIARLKKEMFKAAEQLDFETAATLRDQLRQLEHQALDLPDKV